MRFLALTSLAVSLFYTPAFAAEKDGGCSQPGFQPPSVYQKAAGYWRGVNFVYGTDGALSRTEKFEDTFTVTGSTLKITAQIAQNEPVVIRGTFDCLGNLSVAPQDNLPGWFTNALSSENQLFLETTSPNKDVQIFETFSVASDTVISATKQVYRNGSLEVSSFGVMQKAN
jgi:hypothetical protein